MDEYNFKFRVVKNIGRDSIRAFGIKGTIIEVKKGKFKTMDGYEFDNRGMFYKNIQEVKNHLSEDDWYKTEIELVEESEELTPVEFLKLCHEICEVSACSKKDCIMFDNCYSSEKGSKEKTYEIVKQYKKDKELKKKEPVYAAVWRYEIISDEKIVGTEKTKEDARNACEEYASEHPFDSHTSYRKFCTYEEVIEE